MKLHQLSSEATIRFHDAILDKAKEMNLLMPEYSTALTLALGTMVKALRLTRNERKAIIKELAEQIWEVSK